VRKVFSLILLIALLPFSSACEAETNSVHMELRALLVGADQFKTHPNTAPAAENNLQHMAIALSLDARGYEKISTSHNDAFDYESFAALVDKSFAGAKDGDVSLFYISTHGLYEEGMQAMDFGMLLSDGQSEYRLSAGELYRALLPVPGMKILIIDTCNSGALIDRGLLGSGQNSLFTNRDFKVITASGGSEPSFLWSTGQGMIRGGSYFADILTAGISGSGNYAADENRDGEITLREVHSYLLRSYGVATPQVYPRQDEMTLLRYDVAQAPRFPQAVSDLVLDQSVLSSENKDLSFSFTLNRPARLAYQLVYQKGGQWQFAQSQVIGDDRQTNGDILPGRKDVSLGLRLADRVMSGYVLLFVTTVFEDSSTPLAQSLLLVEPMSGDPQLISAVPQAFTPKEGQELPIYIGHAFALRISVQIKDQSGRTAAILATEQATRPENLPGGGSLFYWNGTMNSGEPAQSGLYYAEVTAQVGESLYKVQSASFALR
jgi:hypothetical protein